jgi:hypothetical protein
VQLLQCSLVAAHLAHVRHGCSRTAVVTRGLPPRQQRQPWGAVRRHRGVVLLHALGWQPSPALTRGVPWRAMPFAAAGSPAAPQGPSRPLLPGEHTQVRSAGARATPELWSQHIVLPPTSQAAGDSGAHSTSAVFKPFVHVMFAGANCSSKSRMDWAP